MPKPHLSIIAAMALNRVIGRDNRLPWHLPNDLKHFKALTLGKPMLMGRKTWESLPGILPGRRHIIISRNPNYQATGAELATDLDAAIRLAGPVEEVMLVGGAQLYTQALPLADRLYLTLVKATLDGDAFFPEFDQSSWQLRGEEDHQADARHAYGYSFMEYRRKNAICSSGQ